MIGLGRSTVSTIVGDVTEAIVTCMWKKCVTAHMPVGEQDFKNKILDMEEFWLFPFTWAAVDDCHIPIKCPPGGAESMKRVPQFQELLFSRSNGNCGRKIQVLVGKLWFPGKFA